jgi:hypothetical protein
MIARTASTEPLNVQIRLTVPKEKQSAVSIASNLKAWLERASLTHGGKPNQGWFEASCRRSQLALHFAKEEMERELQTIIREGYGEQHPQG